MIASAAFLALLDAAILSETPDLTRIAFALLVTVVVGSAILIIWRNNTRLERAAADLEKSASSGGKPPSAGPRKKTSGEAAVRAFSAWSGKRRSQSWRRRHQRDRRGELQVDHESVYLRHGPLAMGAPSPWIA